MARLCGDCEHNGKCDGLPYCGGIYFEPEVTDDEEDEEEEEEE